jgi:beta-N-acetylhexosaminidase
MILLMGQANSSKSQKACFLETPTPWADSVFKQLTLEQKIGQLFMAAAWSDPKHKDYDPGGIQELIKKYNIGGLIFMQGSPYKQAKLTNQYQSLTEIPLLIAMDAEWGLGMRLDSTIAYPRQLTLGASNNDSLIYLFGCEMARQLKRLGVHVSFSPVVDINNNPKNPVISNRAFGEDKEIVTSQSIMYMQGLQNNGVLACAKHFPGHGDTETDSHKDLPLIAFNKERLDSLELYPYRQLIKKGLGSVMTAHLYVPAIDDAPNVPSTLSPKVINGLLRDEMKFDGLIFTDAMNMQGVAKYYSSGEADLQALIAGNDVILFSQNIPLAIQKIKAAVDSGLISMKTINQHCMRVLKTKEWAGLNHIQSVDTKGLYDDLNSAPAQILRRKLVEQSITVIKNQDDLVPLNTLTGKRIAVVSVGTDKDSPFAQSISHYCRADFFSMEKNPGFNASIALRDSLSKYDVVIAGLLNTSNKTSKNFGVTNESARILNSIGADTKVILAVFANPYAIDILKDLSNIETIVVSYQDDEMTEEVTAEVITGAISAQGVLPVTACSDFAQGAGICTNGGNRLRWVEPEFLGLRGNITPDQNVHQLDVQPSGNPSGDYEEDMMEDNFNKSGTSEDALARIDQIAKSGITKGAYPGCRVLISKDGNVVYDKSFGTLNWKDNEPVNTNTMYDLASITKVASTTLSAMKLVDMGKLDVEKKLGDYLVFPQGNPYADVSIKNMLSHCAGFTPWIPFYQHTIKDGKLSSDIYRTRAEPGFSLQVANGIYIIDSYRDSIFNTIISTPISSERTYNYSDLGYYFMQRIVEKQSGVTLDQFVKDNFYNPLGLSSMTYNPLKGENKSNIAPTENDQTFRSQHLKGYVHDQGAAMMGGVAGHAGLFSTAQDLAVVMQMLMDNGSYGGRQYITPETILLFNTRHFSGNRRGLGFDKPSLSPGNGSTCRQAGNLSFGHTGFTGTMCWADPETGIVFVFLSNRVNPDAENKKLQQLNIRTEIQAEAYKAFGFPTK